MAIGLVHLARMDGQIDAAVLPPQLAHGRQEARRVALVVVFPADHVDADEYVAVVVHEPVDESQAVFGIRPESQDCALEPHHHTGIDGILLLQAFAQYVDGLLGRHHAAVRLQESPDGELRFEVNKAFIAERLHVLIKDFSLDPRVIGEREQPLPVPLEKFVPAFVIFVEADAVHPRRFFCFGQFFQPLVLGFFAGTQLVILALLDGVKHQVIGSEAECIAAVVAAILDAYLGVILVAALFLGECRLVPPLRESGAREMIVQVAALGHVIEHAVQVFCIAGCLEVVEPVRAGNVQRQQKEPQNCNKLSDHCHAQRKTYLSAKINAMR